jgi:hypothetical protein
MSNKSFCDLCGKEVPETGLLFLLHKHGIAVSAQVNSWGKKEIPRVQTDYSGFSMKERTRNHICHRCLLDIVRTGEPDPNGWTKEEQIELGIGNVTSIKARR